MNIDSVRAQYQAPACLFYICACVACVVLEWIVVHLYAPLVIPPRSVSSPYSAVMMKSVAGSPTQFPTLNKLIHH